MENLRYSFPFCSLFSPHSTAPNISSIPLMCVLQRAIIFLLLNFTVIFLILNFTSQNGVVKFDPLTPRLPAGCGSNSRSNISNVLYIHDFGARGNGVSDDTEAFRKAWEVACSSSSGARIIVPDGKKFLVRPVTFSGPCRSNLTLSIFGTIVAPKDPDIWEGLNPNKWLHFHRLKYLTVEGGGTVDGSGQEWWARSCKTNRTNPCRRAPKAVTFYECKHLIWRNITSINSPQFHMSFTRSEHIELSYLKIFAPAKSPNTDGIHFTSCKNVEVKDCTISTGDDCISIVNNSLKIHIQGITCGPGHGISIGSLGGGNARHQVQDIEVIGAKLTNTTNGVRIKTWQGGSGFVRRISFRNLSMENVSNPIIIDQYYCDSFAPCANKTSAVSIQDVSFVGIKGTSATKKAISFTCSDSSPCTGLYLEDILLTSNTGGETTSFYWQAKGSSLGRVHPPPSFSSSCGNSTIIQHI